MRFFCDVADVRASRAIVGLTRTDGGSLPDRADNKAFNAVPEAPRLPSHAWPVGCPAPASSSTSGTKSRVPIVVPLLRTLFLPLRDSLFATFLRKHQLSVKRSFWQAMIIDQAGRAVETCNYYLKVSPLLVLTARESCNYFSCLRYRARRCRLRSIRLRAVWKRRAYAYRLCHSADRQGLRSRAGRQ